MSEVLSFLHVLNTETVSFPTPVSLCPTARWELSLEPLSPQWPHAKCPTAPMAWRWALPHLKTTRSANEAMLTGPLFPPLLGGRGIHAPAGTSRFSLRLDRSSESRPAVWLMLMTLPPIAWALAPGFLVRTHLPSQALRELCFALSHDW